MDGSDAAAVARARAGEGEAFRLLVERHSHSIFRLAYRMTGNEPDAEALVSGARQETDAGLKKGAVRNLSKMKSKMATNFLLEILNQ